MAGAVAGGGAAARLVLARGVEVEALLLAVWLRRLGMLCAALSVAYFVLGSHPVTNFTMR